MALQRFGDIAHVLGRDVAAISARVHGDAGHAGVETRRDGVEHTRLAPTARIPERRDFVDVDRKTNHDANWIIGAFDRLVNH